LNRATVRKEIEILNDTLQIGRVADNDVVIPDKRLSGKHCKIVRRIDAEGKMSVHIEDSSSNGTFHNKKQVSSSVLYFNDGVGLTRMSCVVDR
jgi:ABC transport system ATP-binding/permease protein